MDTETMMAGREMDAEVARRVMGWTDLCESRFNGRLLGLKPGEVRPRDGGTANHSEVPFASTDVADAFLVVEHLRDRGWKMNLSCNHYVTEPWDCRLFFEGRYASGPEKRAIAHGRTAAEAICRAALEATE